MFSPETPNSRRHAVGAKTRAAGAPHTRWALK